MRIELTEFRCDRADKKGERDLAGRSRSIRLIRWIRPALVLTAQWVLLCFLVGCRTGPLMKSLVIDEKTWTVRRGQAVWQAGRNAPQIAGDLLVATNRDDQSVVHFTKAPFPTIIAQATPTQWQVQFFPERRTLSGPGQPPDEIVWFQLSRALAGIPVTPPWTFQTQNESGWQLKSSASGERLEGYLAP